LVTYKDRLGHALWNERLDCLPSHSGKAPLIRGIALYLDALSLSTQSKRKLVPLLRESPGNGIEALPYFVFHPILIDLPACERVRRMNQRR